MATKKRVKVRGASANDARRPKKATDVEAASDSITNADIEHSDSHTVSAVGSVESADAPAYRVDIESGGDLDASDVERGPA